MLVILIIASAYFTWLGFALRKVNRSYSVLAWFAAGLLGFLSVAGFFRWI
ncbi:MAG: hypothetical protein OEY89_04195 [Gammaproteobacteria bacterium]|nr:hypothetical protein [Gammaproteobacteria bacterium]